MFIAILDLCADPHDRAATRAQLVSEQAAIRAMAGCIDFRVFESLEDDRRLTVLHEWRDDASFSAYLASDGFARSGDVVRPLLTEPPVSRRFHAELAELVD